MSCILALLNAFMFYILKHKFFFLIRFKFVYTYIYIFLMLIIYILKQNCTSFRLRKYMIFYSFSY